jgi:replicative DNA helicase
MSEQGNLNKKNDGKKQDKPQAGGDLSNYVFGKLQPQALQLEEAVLGALMLEKEGLPVVMDILRPESFYTEAHQAIYRAALKLFERSHPVDLLTVQEELKKSGELEKVGGSYYLVELTNRVGSSANIEYHARIIAQKHIQRELIRVSTKTIKDSYEDTTDVFSLLDDAEKGLFAITQNNLSRTYESMGSLSSKLLKQIEELAKKENGLTGVPTGFTDIDRITSGWQPSDLIIIAARPGMGKTSMVLALARNAAVDFGKAVALFSLEMSNIQLVQRLVSMEAEIPGSKFRNGKMEDYEWQQLQSVVERMNTVPIFIDDTPGINIFELRAKCRRLKMQHDIQMVIIDYLQLMTGGGEANKNGNREQEISSISRALKGMAKELRVPVIALSQLSRAVETRGGSKKPMLSDLRECVTGDTEVFLSSGNLVQIKDLVGKNVDVFSLDNEHNKIHTRQTEMVWEVGEKQIWKVILASGRSIRASAEHRLLGFPSWKTVAEMQIGDRIALARLVPEPENSIVWDENHLVLLAHMIGDGSYLKHQPLRYTTASEANSSAVSNAATQGFGVTVNRHIGRCNWHQLVFSGNGNRWHPAGMNLWFKELGIFDQRSHQKLIPQGIFQLKNDQLALFLRHLWATDGTVFLSKKEENRTSPKLAFSTNSEVLASNVANLLLRFGIVARIRTVQQGEYKPMFSVEISGKDAQLIFLEKIGIFGERAEIGEAIKKYHADRISNTNSDTVPMEVFDLVKKTMQEKGISQRKMAALRQTSYGGSSHFQFSPSRDVLANYADVLEDKNLKTIAQNDIFWDTIVSIEPVGIEMVYDLTVPGTENWIANGIISHNSGAIEQDADIVTFIYRPEYYQILEDEQGMSLKNVAEFIIAKHRNGALDTVKLKFTAEFAKFGNLDDPNFAGFDSISADPFGSGAAIITRPSRMNDEDIPF